MIVLGLNAFHGDAAAAVVADGRLVAAAEEERFNRVKHWAGLPAEAARYCLREAGVSLAEVDHVAVSRDPSAHLHKKVLFALTRGPRPGMVKDRLANAAKVRDLRAPLARALGVDPKSARARSHRVEHHRAHVASAFLVSPFEEAAVLSIDGFGDFLSALWGRGSGTSFEPLGRVAFPHSVGVFYTAVTQYLGFPRYGDEYKVMGLAPCGEPEFLEDLRRILTAADDGYRLDLDWFLHHSEGVSMVWDGGEPTLGRVWSDRWTERFGPARAPGDPIESRHRNLAASLQACVEEVLFRLLRRLHDRTGVDRLCMAGGVAFNSVANGKILDETPFREVFLQPAAGDAGTALGAAFHVWHETLGNPRAFRMHHAYWGPEFDDSAMAAALESRRGALAKAGVRTVQGSDGDAVIALAARALAEGKVLGWFQGRMEWGPRALGNRSILADPRRAAMKERLNEIVKKREAFRPFCPSVMAEHSGEWFARGDPEPFMIRVFPVRPEKRAEIPAVTHVDGSGRLQTVSERDNPRYWRLLRAFRDLTGVPILLNTSFNENEPIVCRPEEALDCFLRTRMDVLVLGDTLLERPGGGAEGKAP